MMSIATLSQPLHQLLTTTADQVARQTGCVKRHRRFAGSTLVQTLVFGWRHAPNASLVTLTQMAARRGVVISPQGLAQRFTPELVAALQQVLATATTVMVRSVPVSAALLTRFPGGVWVLDSSTISLPDELAEEWPGCGGGAGQGQAGLKLHVRLDLTTGALDGPALTPSRTSDRRSVFQHAPLPPGSLRLHDRQYVALEVLRDLASAGNFWLSRYHAQHAIVDADGTVWHDRAQRLEALAGPNATVDVAVWLGSSARLPARLIAVRRTPEQAARARAEVRRRAQRNGSTPKAALLALADWLIVITNVPTDRLPLTEALVLLRLRWQIERLFRRWKQHTLLAQWRSVNADRIRCELLAKLIACLLDHWLLVVSCWTGPRRSLDRASRAIGQSVLVLATVFDQPRALRQELLRLGQIIRQTAFITRRRRRPNHLQLVADPSLVALS